MKYNTMVLVWTFGEVIQPSKWNSKKQRAKSNQQQTSESNQKLSLNDLLDKLEDLLLEAYAKERINGTPLPLTLKNYLSNYLNQHIKSVQNKKSRPSLTNLMERLINGELLDTTKVKSPATIKAYKTTQKHLLEFSKSEKFPLDFDTVNVDFFYKFSKYLSDKKSINTNGVAKYMKTLKVFMNKAVECGYTSNLAYKKKIFNITLEETYSTFLTEPEIMKLFNFDLSENNRLEQVRDLFVFGCWVGLRFSDYSNIRPEHIIEIDGEPFIKLITQKTTTPVIIPCNPVVLNIFRRYADNKNKLPKSLSNQKFNEYIKEACKFAGMTEKGRLASDMNKELWQIISSHTARRSFATNYYLQGFPVYDLMKITGHKTEAAFRKYIKITQLDAAKNLARHNKKKNWSEMLLKVAN